ncbi:hypothetical protein K505DRAFT_315881 [Melanomma pulvis-pyrius CBS 109.77]|uniref:DUF1365-domain-containing protein n=1 Tax=Melanomma pulvis-pyrius CBS 109.77 TaxID=1314802 RepID=A0A6A6WVI1_9PLEO|nr:hypothetical protein K505DRAFT_315881 [Melanomma pulvis-pyrius CBS 109.77]
MKSTTYGLKGLLVRFIPYLPFLLPSAIALGWYSWPFLVLWAGCAAVRSHNHDPNIAQDWFIFGAINLYLLKGTLFELLRSIWIETSFRDVAAQPTPSTLILCLTILLGLLATAFFYHRPNRDSQRKSLFKSSIPTGFTEYIPPEHPKPLIFPCRTTHARMFPKHHAFVYSYLLYGIPIFPKFFNDKGTLFGFLDDNKIGKWWLQVRAEDYLERGYGELGFYEKLKMTLKDQGVQETEWSYAYLVTAPRFFGYSFNPVSFWYIYDDQHELKKMILEVNNTFGERRLYVLHGSGPVQSPGTSSSESSTSNIPTYPKKRFVDNWQKDFHVSPFNSRKGAYSLKALNPFPYPDYKSASVDNTITLTSSKAHAKIVARVHSTEPPIDPADLGILGTMRFVGGWFWVGLLTSPRIMKEAFRLYFRRSLNVWLRPEVLSSSIGRMPTLAEIALSKFFRSYLYQLVNESPDQFNITLHTAIPDHPKEFIASTYIQGREINPKIFEIRVLNPSFYTRFVHYAHTSEAFDRECLFTDQRNRTIEISHPEFLPLLLPHSKPPRSDDLAWDVKRRYLNKMRWALLRYLRCPPSEPAYPETCTSPNVDVSDIRFRPFSDMDTFIQAPYSFFIAGSYRKIVTKVFLAQRFAFGFVEVIDVVDILLRICLCYLGSKKLISWARGASQHGLGKHLNRTPNTFLEGPRGAYTGWWWLSGLGMWICACHFYGLFKGYR